MGAKEGKKVALAFTTNVTPDTKTHTPTPAIGGHQSSRMQCIYPATEKVSENGSRKRNHRRRKEAIIICGTKTEHKVPIVQSGTALLRKYLVSSLRMKIADKMEVNVLSPHFQLAAASI